MVLAEMYSIILYVFLGAVHLSTSRNQSLRPQGVTQEMYCMGCEYAVKALEKMLAGPSQEFMDVRVVEALEDVCEAESFETTGFPKHLLVKACEHLLDNHRDIIEPLLIGHYVRHDRPSFMELVQQICIDLTGACPSIRSENDPQSANSQVFIDKETNKFKVKPGDNLKMPNPVKEANEDL